MTLTLLTPTRNRAKCFGLLETYMKRQTLKWDQWIVVNDGKEPYTYTCGQTVVVRDASNDPPGTITLDRMYRVPHSLCFNVLAGLPYVMGDKVLIVEDDDWYGADYVRVLAEALDGADLVGLREHYYWHAGKRFYSVQSRSGHTAFACTAFRSKLLPLLRLIALEGNPYLDKALWDSWEGSKSLITHAGGLHVGVKGMEGEPGVSFMGHTIPLGEHDPTGGKLRDRKSVV